MLSRVKIRWRLHRQCFTKSTADRVWQWRDLPVTRFGWSQWHLLVQRSIRDGGVVGITYMLECDVMDTTEGWGLSKLDVAFQLQWMSKSKATCIFSVTYRCSVWYKVATVTCQDVRSSVRLSSLCLSHSCIVPKRLNPPATIFCHRIAPSFWFPRNYPCSQITLNRRAK